MAIRSEDRSGPPTRGQLPTVGSPQNSPRAVFLLSGPRLGPPRAIRTRASSLPGAKTVLRQGRHASVESPASPFAHLLQWVCYWSSSLPLLLPLFPVYSRLPFTSRASGSSVTLSLPVFHVPQARTCCGARLSKQEIINQQKAAILPHRPLPDSLSHLPKSTIRAVHPRDRSEGGGRMLRPPLTVDGLAHAEDSIIPTCEHCLHHIRIIFPSSPHLNPTQHGLPISPLPPPEAIDNDSVSAPPG